MITDQPGSVITEAAPALDEEALRAVAIDNQPNAIKLARDASISSLPYVVIGVPAALAGLLVTELRLLFWPGVTAAAWSIGRIARYTQIVRQDPVERWQRELRQNREQAQAAYDFQLRSAAVTPYVTGSLIGIIVLVTAVEFLTGLRHAVPAAALVKPAVRSGAWWRLLTAAYLHGSGEHLVFNMIALFSLGRMIEIYDRRARVPLVFLVSAIGCSLASTALLPASSLGASGGIVGLGGYLLTTAGVREDGAPSWIRRQMGVLLVSLVITGLVGYRYIDNAGHAGGFVTGAAIGLLLRQPDGEPSASAELAGWVSMAILLAGAIFTVVRLAG